MSSWLSILFVSIMHGQANIEFNSISCSTHYQVWRYNIIQNNCVIMSPLQCVQAPTNIFVKDKVEDTKLSLAEGNTLSSCLDRGCYSHVII